MHDSQKRRIPEQLLDYWRRIRGDKPLPIMQDVKPAYIPELWPDCFLVEVREIDGELKFSYVYQGDNVKVMFGDAALSLEDGLAEKYKIVCQSKDYLIDELVYTSRQNLRIKYRQIILPLGDEERGITHLLGGMRHATERVESIF